MPTRSIDAHETFKIGEKKGYKSRVLHVENHMYTSKACYGVVWSRQIRGHIKMYLTSADSNRSCKWNSVTMLV